MIKAPHLERLLLILETVSRADGALNTNEICQATKLPSPTVYRLIRELIDAGLLQSEPERRYSIGYRLTQLVLGTQTDRDLAELAKPVLKEAANQHHAAFFLSRARGRGVEIIHVQTPEDDKVSYLHPGLGFRPMHACSCAKAVAAFSDRNQVSKALGRHLRAFTEHTRTNVEELQSEFDKIRQQGYAECLQELELGICSVAAPILEKNTACTLSIGATGSLRLFTEPFRRKLGKALISYASVIGKSIDRTGRAEVIKQVN